VRREILCHPTEAHQRQLRSLQLAESQGTTRPKNENDSIGASFFYSSYPTVPCQACPLYARTECILSETPPVLHPGSVLYHAGTGKSPMYRNGGP
jgi:hypothetical protein